MKNIDRSKFLKLIGLSSLGLISSGMSASVLSKFGGEESLFSAPPIRVAHLTDIHIESGIEAERGLASCLNAVNSLNHKPDFIINGGDAIMNSALTYSKEKIKKQWGLFHSIFRSENSIPITNCIGNHDLIGWPIAKSNEKESKYRAMEEYEINKPYYSLTKGKWKFIVLDSIQCKNSIPGYFAQLDEEQMNWLKDELSNTPQDNFICIISHVPILAICTMFDSLFTNKRHRRVSSSILHADAGELTSIFYQFPNVKSCLSGHIHMIDHVNYLGVDYYCNGAVSGSWWKGNHHQFPPSFSIMNFFDDGKVTREIHCYNWNQSTKISVTQN
jgi:3',5'-cyclic AMP phosphodiesterase CpdA